MSNLTRDYEAILIARPETEAEAGKLQAQFAELVTRHKGRVTESVNLGKRRLNYRIHKLGEGVHLQVRFQLPPEETAALRKAASMSEWALRFFLVKEKGERGETGEGRERGGEGNHGQPQ